MASARAQSQLSKQVIIDIPGTIPANTQLPPILLANQPARPPFPAYNVGYNVRANVRAVRQRIPGRPANGHGSPHPYQMLAEDNLHPALFQLEPAPSPLTDIEVPLLVNEQTGQIETSPSGRQLRYFWHLPRWVTVDVLGQMMELWLRLDPRVEMADIMDRVNLDNRAMPAPNVFNMRRIRFREAIDVPSFNTGRREPGASEVERIGVLTREQILLNTAMRVDLQNNRLLRPILDTNRNRLGYVDSGLPIDYFLVNYPLPIAIPSDRQVVTLALRHRMQTLAVRRGLGNGASAFQNLPPALLPRWWMHRANVQPARITDIDNRTHDEWVQGILQQYPGITRAGRPRSRARQGPTQPQPQQPQQQQRQRQRQQPQQVQPAAAPAMQPAAARTNAAIDPRLLVANPPHAFPGLMRPNAPTELEESRLIITSPDGATHYYVEPVHHAMYR
ncbi:hypothetical protein PV05_05928 [Exophiala xenobiotica]|uniref:Uncharacterized protein n=1 Tax=Exophiala xenobiotica TaxID=348802 RepID=A0A0D2FBC8_9EURO|nr:uncharacterized protein PV05_05928 [Exophiala xenobiotica]KIW57374.1 hypothetical protein PV05_05928 [Exophiala xenobiotica]